MSELTDQREKLTALQQERVAVIVVRDKARAKQRKWSEREHEANRTVLRLEDSVRRQLEHVERLSYPVEPTREGTIVRFRKVFQGNAKTYHFAAVLSNGGWYVTGTRSPQNLTWVGLVDFARRDNMLTSDPSEVGTLHVTQGFTPPF